MLRLTIMRGVSGSGKSTLARNLPGVVVSRDSLRESFFPIPVEDYYQSPNLRDMEDSITRIQDAAIESLLRDGKDVIIDNTNIEWKYVKALANIGYACGADVRLHVIDVPLDYAISRVIHRAAEGGRYVDEAIIRKQYERFQKTKNLQLEAPQVIKPYHGSPGRPKAFLVDIDGTLAHRTCPIHQKGV